MTLNSVIVRIMNKQGLSDKVYDLLIVEDRLVT